MGAREGARSRWDAFVLTPGAVAADVNAGAHCQTTGPTPWKAPTWITIRWLIRNQPVTRRPHRQEA